MKTFLSRLWSFIIWIFNLIRRWWKKKLPKNSTTDDSITLLKKESESHHLSRVVHLPQEQFKRSRSTQALNAPKKTLRLKLKKYAARAKKSSGYFIKLEKKEFTEKDRPWITTKPHIIYREALHEWPQLSQQILSELFFELGIQYIPEVVLSKMEHQDPLSAFVNFCNRFDSPTGTPAMRGYLQKVVLLLSKMDQLQQQHTFNPEPIYKKLEQHKLVEAEKGLEELKKTFLID